MDRFKKTAFKNCYKELCSQAEDFLDDLLERGSPSSAPCSGRREVQANESLLRLCEALVVDELEFRLGHDTLPPVHQRR